ncbi:fam-e protein [Plasmodium gallinaceum]|uniref:Fam-e protein n=1 Tax=Plasmodium gallinaceum TaxID=5849 RepID=A0A1J1H3R9_PLAGA|nr:fam-e protein [Plasmodium gallinaceum]CRG97994.1 fam-e protein [Plasmodium gallinaceum]
MALLYNEGCKNSDDDFTKCDVFLCFIKKTKFRTLYCDPTFKSVIKYISDNISNDLSKNIFTHEITEPLYYRDSKITILSNDNKNGIVFLFEAYPHTNSLISNTYLCRIRKINQKLTLCEYIQENYFEKRLSFRSFDVINREDDNNHRFGLKDITNPRHTINKLKYDDIFFSKDSCHFTTEGFDKIHVCRYSICKKNDRGHIFCKDAKFNGNLINIKEHINYEENQKYIYLPNNCIEENGNFHCTPYLCKYEKMNELYPCDKLEISAVKGINPYIESSEMRSTNSRIIPHENDVRPSTIFAISFFPFLIMLVFIWCYIYKKLRRNRRKDRVDRSKEP